MADCCQRATDLILLNLLYSQLLTLCRLPSVLHQLRDVPSPSSSALLLAVCDGLLHRLSSTLQLVRAAVARESDGGRVRNALKVARFFLLQLAVLSTHFPAQLALRILQPTLRQAHVIATAIIALPPSQHRQQLWQQYRDVLHSKMLSSFTALLASPQLPLEHQRQLCLATAATDAEAETTESAAAAVARTLFTSAVLASSRDLPAMALSVLFHSVAPALLLDLPLCWPDIADLSPPSSGGQLKEPITVPSPSLFSDLFEQCCGGLFTLLSAILSALPPADSDYSQPATPPPCNIDGVTAADVELFLWRSMGSCHPLCARLSTLLWARTLTEWDPSFRSRQLQLAVELLEMEQGEGVVSLHARLAPGRRVVCEWLACVLPLFDAQQQQSLFDLMDVANVLQWYAASPPISLVSAPSSPANPSPLYSSQSSSLTPTQVLASSQPAFPSSRVPISVSVHLLSHLHLPSLDPAIQASVCRSALSAVAHLLLQCMTPAVVSSGAALSLVAALFRVLDFLLQSADTFEAAFPTAEQRAAELQPIILSLARLFSVPRATAAPIDNHTAQPPLFPSLLSQLSKSSALSVALVPALCSLLDTFLLHHVALPPLLKVLSGLSSLLSTLPFLRLLLPPILVRLSSAPLVQHPTVPITANPNQQLIAQLTALWHTILTPHPSASTTPLTEAVAIPSFWAFTSALSTSPFAKFVTQLLPPAQHATLITALAEYSQRMEGDGGAGRSGEEQRALYHWQAHLLLQHAQWNERGEQLGTDGVDMNESSVEGAVGAAATMDAHSDGVGVMASALAAVESVRRSREAVLAVLAEVAPLAADERQRITKMVEEEREKWLRLSP